jgi:glycosyltransferase involved in cell wall biosynthesis
MSSGAYNNVIDGVSKTLNRLVGDLQARDYQVVVIAPVADEPAMMHNGLLYPAPSVSVPFRPEYRLALGLDRCTREFFEAYRPDIVHIATPDYLGQQVQTWAAEQRLPVVCSYHTRFNSYLPYYVGSGNLLTPVDTAVWAWMRFFYNKCDHVYPPTPSVSQELRAHRVTSELRIWPRGIDLAMFNVGRRSPALRTSWGAASDDILVILTVCRLVWEKNLQEIIDAIRLLEKNGEAFRTVVVGDGPAREAMEAQLPNAVFTGFLGGTNLSTAFASADLFFFPSLTETWGAVTLEAMASGLPVIVADAPGSKELVANGKSGFLIKPGRPQRWANAITRLMHDPALRKELGHRALAQVSETEGFTWKRATDMLLGHYADLLTTNKRYAELFEVPAVENSPDTDTAG